jgi:hypothetical protein
MEANQYLATVPIGMLQAEIILAPPDFAPRRKQAPEQRLVIAILQEAIHSVQKYRFAKDRRGLRLFEEARRWFLAEASDWPYSFESICEVIDLDSNAVRQRLRLAPISQPELRPSALNRLISGA